MCRLMAFSGTCTRCGEWFQWHDLSQELACLESKNNGVFGDCRRGVHVEDHPFEQECDACTAIDMADEGFAEADDPPPAAGDYTEQAWQDELKRAKKGKEKADGGGSSSSSRPSTKDRDRDRDKGKHKRQRTS